MRKRHCAPHVIIDLNKLRGPEFKDEMADCVVRALALAKKIPYAKAHAICARMGRKKRAGVRNYFTQRIYESQGFVYIRSTPKFHLSPRGFCVNLYPTFKQWLDVHPVRWHKGTYILSVADHVFAMVDGVVQETWGRGPRTRILGHYKLQK